MLGNLEDARNLELVQWAWKESYPTPKKSQAHIYQFTVSGHWDNEQPDVNPLCGASSFKRGSHNPITGDARYLEPQGPCTWCLVRLVTDYPHLFAKGGK